MMKMKNEGNPALARQFNRTVRYIDDLLTINNDGLMKKHMSEILTEAYKYFLIKFKIK